MFEGWTDRIPGGKADDRTPYDFDQESLLKGVNVEMEHTYDIMKAMEISMDHLEEDPLYYDKLKKIHKESLYEMSLGGVQEAEYKGRKVTLNKPFRNGDDPKKFSVYVKDGDKVKKVNFGSEEMKIKKNNPERKKSYCARSKGIGNTKDKTSANYWSRKMWDC